jgi:hypothetical protein
VTDVDARLGEASKQTRLVVADHADELEERSLEDLVKAVNHLQSVQNRLDLLTDSEGGGEP